MLVMHWPLSVASRGPRGRKWMRRLLKALRKRRLGPDPDDAVALLAPDSLMEEAAGR